MNKRLIGVCLSLAFGLVSMPATAQTNITVRQAALSVPFGVSEGSIVLVSDQLIFVNNNDPDASFVILRSNVDSMADEGQQVVTVQLRQAVAGRSRLTFRVGEPDAVLAWSEATAARTVSSPAATGAAGDVASFQAEHDHRLRSCLGQLIITETGIGFESVSEVDDSRHWSYADIRELEQDGIYRVSITPFIGNSYNLRLIGRGLDSEQYRNIVNRIAEARRR